MVPRTWTDFYLPLQISVPADINRVMVGRIELVTPEQRNMMHHLESFSVSEIKHDREELWTNFNTKYFPSLVTSNRITDNDIQQFNKDMAQLDSGQSKLASFISVPRTYRTYLALGRFRNALILDEAKQNPSPELTNFIAYYRLQGYR